MAWVASIASPKWPNVSPTIKSAPSSTAHSTCSYFIKIKKEPWKTRGTSFKITIFWSNNTSKAYRVEVMLNFGLKSKFNYKQIQAGHMYKMNARISTPPPSKIIILESRLNSIMNDNLLIVGVSFLISASATKNFWSVAVLERARPPPSIMSLFKQGSCMNARTPEPIQRPPKPPRWFF